MRLALRTSRIEPSITLALDARAKSLAAAGVDVVNMTVGEPDFRAPEIAREAAARMAREGDVRYTPPAGTVALRGALAEYLRGTRGGAWEPEQVTVCHSAKHALSSTLMTLVEEGDEVLLPLPAWASYFDQVRITGARPIPVDSPLDATGFHPDLRALERAITERTRVLMINSPNNPSGSVWGEREMRRVAELAVKHDLWLLSDEIYRELVYDGVSAPSPHGICSGSEERTLIIDGASKCFAMTGYRVGFVAGPPEVTAAIAKLNSQTDGSPNSIAQHAYATALQNPPPELETMRLAFRERRNVLVAGLRELGLDTPEARGAFYAFPNAARFMDERGSVGFCADLLEEQHVALIPGAAFGIDTHVRLSYATDLGSIRAALKRLGKFLDSRRT